MCAASVTRGHGGLLNPFNALTISQIRSISATMFFIHKTNNNLKSSCQDSYSPSTFIKQQSSKERNTVGFSTFPLT